MGSCELSSGICYGCSLYRSISSSSIVISDDNGPHTCLRICSSRSRSHFCAKRRLRSLSARARATGAADRSRSVTVAPRRVNSAATRPCPQAMSRPGGRRRRGPTRVVRRSPRRRCGRRSPKMEVGDQLVPGGSADLGPLAKLVHQRGSRAGGRSSTSVRTQRAGPQPVDVRLPPARGGYGRWCGGGRVRTAGLAERAEFRADRVAVAVAEVVEDAQRLLPGLAGGVGVSGGVVGVAKVGECGRFVVPVADVSVQADGVLVTGEGCGVVAEVVVGVAEAIPGAGLALAVAEFLVQRKGPLAGDEGPPVMAEQGVAPADRVEGAGLPDLVAGGPVQDERLLGVFERPGVVTPPLAEVGQAVLDVGLPGPDRKSTRLNSS